MEKKYVFVDIDGTLMDSSSRYIPESAKAAIKKARERGSRVFISTGRTNAEVMDFIRAIGFDGYICSAGTEIIADDKEIFGYAYPKDELERITNIAGSLGAGVVYQCSQKSYVDKLGYDIFRKLTAIKNTTKSSELQRVPDSSHTPLDEYLKNPEPVRKIACVTDDFDVLIDIAARVAPEYTLITHGERSDGSVMGEITPSYINKAAAMQKIVDYFGEENVVTYAYGDSNNDIEMIKAADHGVAMGNGVQAAKDAADEVADDLNKDGLYKSFKKNHLIENDVKILRRQKIGRGKAMKKYIFLDIDGTLMDSKSRHIPESAKAAIKKARERGSKVFIATGRTAAEVMDFIRAIGFDGYICSAGADIVADGKNIESSAFSKDELTKLRNMAESLNIGMVYQCRQRSYVDESCREMFFELFRDTASPSEVQRLPDSSHTPFAEYMKNPEPVQLIAFVSADYGKVAELAQKIRPKYHMAIHGEPKDIAIIGEITPCGVNKATAMQKIVDYFGEENVITYAYGDSNNDIEMLKAADFGVAMGNGVQAAKDAADEVADDLNKDGLYRSFKKNNII
jgi:hypothetical protein